MATNDYLTITDVETIKIKQLYEADDDYIQAFIDSTNNWYESYCQNLNISTDNIAYPVSPEVMDLLRAELDIRVGKAHIGGTDSMVSTDSVYTAMYNLGREESKRILPRINELAITGKYSRSSNTVVFGRVVRR
jgi:hypothetical protein